MVLSEVFGNSTTALWNLPDVPVKLFALDNGIVHQVGTAIVSEAAAPFETKEVRTPPNHDLPSQQGTALVVFQTVVIVDEVKDFAYPIHSTLTTTFCRLWEMSSQASVTPWTFNQGSPSKQITVETSSASWKLQLWGWNNHV